MLGPRRAATRLLWSWAVGRSTGSDVSGTVMKVQGQFNGDRLIDVAKLMQHFGFASRPPANTDLVAICPSGEPTSALVIASNSQEKRPPALEEGDAALYDSRGASLWLSENGIVLEAAGQPVKVNGASSVTIEASGITFAINDDRTISVTGVTTATITASESVILNTPVLKVSGDVTASSFS